ncbi:liver stage antigen-1, putative [Perkinsus marinus ATCC 50983]|uniref:Liver stage antigen-1, putative n=1 Tax=Perkinsus marinus (strain ATCC 50983 / TXsc) TaxID=423536 RepID=C5KBW2_PERM5|nr:liver stage antigen-1, putative [Perkinsus marinus ATCC 50983]EER17993.1 liver stage antigen-1, putative [Perkinsus marinus ATCC 50983]|eukprot:XP_002786197.1 liver stage antigen-1, putative [Perkinsus marinus ATCC 50983]
MAPPRSKPSTGYNEFKKREKQHKFQRKAKQMKKYHRMLQHEDKSESVNTAREDYEDRLFNPFGKPRVTESTHETKVVVDEKPVVEEPTEPEHNMAEDEVIDEGLQADKKDDEILDEMPAAPEPTKQRKGVDVRENPFKKEQRQYQQREAERERREKEIEEREIEIKNQKIRSAKARRAHGRLLSARTKKGQPKMHMQLESMMRRYKKKQQTD